MLDWHQSTDFHRTLAVCCRICVHPSISGASAERLPRRVVLWDRFARSPVRPLPRAARYRAWRAPLPPFVILRRRDVENIVFAGDFSFFIRLRVSREKFEGVGMQHLGLLAEARGFQVLADQLHDAVVHLDEGGMCRASTEGLNADAACSGEEIKEASVFHAR